jgi:hypothetical protein
VTNTFLKEAREKNAFLPEEDAEAFTRFMEWAYTSGMYQGRIFGSTFGVGALSGQLTSQTGGKLLTQSLFINIIKINVVADDSNIKLFDIKFIVFFNDGLARPPCLPCTPRRRSEASRECPASCLPVTTAVRRYI